MSGALPWRHALLALAVVAVWGTNFVIIKAALAHLPPLCFAGLRFLLAWLPAVLLLPRPPVPWSHLAGYGVAIGAGQFGLLFLAMRGDITPGLASLLIQTQVFFTIGLSMWRNGERLRLPQLLALGLAAAGVVTIGVHTDGSTTVRGVLMVLAAAACWAVGNTISRASGRVNMLAYVVWSSVFAAVPLLALSWLIEGPERIAHGLAEADLGTWAAVAWQSVGNALFGYAAWGWLLARHPAAVVSPMALLVPVFGMAASTWWIDEPLPGWKLLAAALVLAGLALNLLAPRWAAWRAGPLEGRP